MGGRIELTPLRLLQNFLPVTAQIDHAAAPAFWRPRLADIASVKDQPMMGA